MQTLKTKTVSKRLEILAELYKKQRASDLMVRTVDKILLYETQISHEKLIIALFGTNS